MKGFLYRGFTALCVMIYVVSLYSIGSGWLPIITAILSGAWIIHVLRKDEVYDDVDEN
jgi:hypothetical protein